METSFWVFIADFIDVQLRIWAWSMKVFVQTYFWGFITDFIEVQFYIWAWSMKVFVGTSYRGFIESLSSQHLQWRFFCYLTSSWQKKRGFYNRVYDSEKWYIDNANLFLITQWLLKCRLTIILNWVNLLRSWNFRINIKAPLLLQFPHHVAMIYYWGVIFIDKISTSCCKDIS